MARVRKPPEEPHSEKSRTTKSRSTPGTRAAGNRRRSQRDGRMRAQILGEVIRVGGPATIADAVEIVREGDMKPLLAGGMIGFDVDDVAAGLREAGAGKRTMRLIDSEGDLPQNFDDFETSCFMLGVENREVLADLLIRLDQAISGEVKPGDVDSEVAEWGIAALKRLRENLRSI